MAQWIGALVPSYLIVWLLQRAAKRWKGEALPLALVHAVSLVICVFLWSVGTYHAREFAWGPRLLVGSLVYLPPQIFWLLADFWTEARPKSFLRGPSVGVLVKDASATNPANHQ